MKNILTPIIIIGIVLISFSVFYYFVLFLPNQNLQSDQDIKAIRNAIAPSAEQRKVKQQDSEQAIFNKAVDAYYSCQGQLPITRQNYVKAQCQFSTNPSDCSVKIIKTPGYKQLDCKYPLIK